jgi:hypothetical protein
MFDFVNDHWVYVSLGILFALLGVAAFLVWIGERRRNAHWPIETYCECGHPYRDHPGNGRCGRCSCIGFH